MEALSKDKIYTIDDIYALPDGERAELIDGKIHYMTMPGLTHQRISGYLHNQIANYIDSKNGVCEVYAAPFAVFLNDDDINYVDPEKQMVTVYGFEKESVEQYNFGEDVPVGIYDEFSIKIE